MSPPINDLYPVPAVTTAFVEKSSMDQSLGIFITNDDEHTVVVSRLKPDSLLNGSGISEGAEILAVNGEAVHSRKQLVDIIMAYPNLEFTALDATRASIPPYCYLEVAPTSKINPGISFDNCCDQTMVMIAQVFLADLCKTRLRRGDIVLAINGIPVWKTADAYAEQLTAARQYQSVVLYCVDMNALRDHFALAGNRKNKWVGDVPREAQVTKTAVGHYTISDRKCNFDAVVNLKTQLLEDRTEAQSRIKVATGGDYSSKDLALKVSYDRVCKPVFASMNALMQEQLDVLKMSVVSEAWKHTMDKGGDVEGRCCVPYILPSAPSAPSAGMGMSVIGVYDAPPPPTVPLPAPIEEEDRYLSI